MSIDARVEFVLLNEDGSGELRLQDRPKSPYETTGGIRGQSALRFDGAPHEVTALNGLDVWGPSSCLMLGDQEIASRIGYGKIAFHPRSVFVAAVGRYHARRRELATA
jgi:hypothetical protein